MNDEGKNIDRIEGATNIEESGNEKFPIVKGVVNITNKR